MISKNKITKDCIQIIFQIKSYRKARKQLFKKVYIRIKYNKRKKNQQINETYFLNLKAKYFNIKIFIFNKFFF